MAAGRPGEIRREEKSGVRLSIIALTANAMPEDRKQLPRRRNGRFFK